MGIHAGYEWQIETSDGQGLVSYVLRHTLADAAALVEGPDRADPEAVALQQIARQAVADGLLVLPPRDV